jgi:hypothetical protein
LGPMSGPSRVSCFRLEPSAAATQRVARKDLSQDQKATWLPSGEKVGPRSPRVLCAERMTGVPEVLLPEKRDIFNHGQVRDSILARGIGDDFRRVGDLVAIRAPVVHLDGFDAIPGAHGGRFKPILYIEEILDGQVIGFVGGHLIGNIGTVGTPERIALHLGVIGEPIGLTAGAVGHPDIPIAIGLRAPGNGGSVGAPCRTVQYSRGGGNHGDIASIGR